MNQILEAVVLSSGRQMVLATIIHVEGSSYRKEGSSMLIFEDKSRVGMLTAGCLEEDIIEKSGQVLASEKPWIATYDMARDDDLSWGRGAGCNGTLTILIEPITKSLLANLLSAKESLDKQTPVARIIRFSNDFEIVDNEFLLESNARFRDFPTGLHRDEKGLFFIHHLFPKPRLYVLGAGEDAQPVVSLAAKTGFNVTVVDWRPAFCLKENFPGATGILTGPLEVILEEISTSPKDFAIIMTHQFTMDQLILDRLLKNGPLFYLGILGPKDRTARLLRGSPAPPWLHSPVGLAISAEGPEEIAVSIVAEMIGELRKTKVFSS